MSAIFAPVLIQVALTFVILFWLGGSRLSASQSPAFRKSVAAGEAPNFGRQADLLSANLNNQFETPVLFYAAIALALATDSVTPVLTALAWVFVVLRLAHAAIHVTVNHVRTRFLVFLVATTVLIVLWIVLSIAILGQ